MLQKNTALTVASVFFTTPTRDRYLREISREIGIAHTSVKKELDSLVEKGIIVKRTETRGAREYPVYKADIHSKDYKREKRIFNISSIIDSGLVEHLVGGVMPDTIILFGSYLLGEDVEESDIDLFVQAQEEKLDLGPFERSLGRPIQLHFRKDFKNLPEELKNNVLNGLPLQGFLEVFE
ncbi:MAG: nucleotidyltransferase domain-containing protein [Candidatus Woesearchaeota archaeon]